VTTDEIAGMAARVEEEEDGVDICQIDSNTM
jgi:hypothetical protein